MVNLEENLLERKTVQVSRKFAVAKNGPVSTKFAAANYSSPIVSVLVFSVFSLWSESFIHKVSSKTGQVSRKFAAAKNGRVSRKFTAAANKTFLSYP